MEEINIILENGEDVSGWMVRVGEPIAEGQCIAKYIDRLKRYSELAAPSSGYIKQIGNSKQKNCVAVMVACTHDVQYAGLCAMCGKDVSKLGTVAIAHAHPKIAVSHKMAQRIDDEIATRLLSSKKLSLVLDLDNTLIHATTDKILRDAPTMNHNDIFEFTLPPDPAKYFVKLRPHLINFLVELEKLYELHIYTMGTRQYASKIAEIVNSHVPLFTPGRIVGRDDSLDMRSKDLQQIFPCDDKMVLIVDDREDVWKNRSNLIRIEAYHYFQATRELNELPGDRKKIDEVAKAAVLKELEVTKVESTEETIIKEMVEAEKSDDSNGSKTSESESSSEEELINGNGTLDGIEVQKNGNQVQDGEIHQHHSDPSESILSETDSFLNVVKGVLFKVHEIYYESDSKDKDAKEILRRVRLGVLNGCTILFSGIFPTNVHPETNDCWKLAIALGAKCSKEFTKSVTHVIGATPTEKVNRATLTPGVYLINLNWLFQSEKNWKRADEKQFPVTSNNNSFPVLMKGTPIPIITPLPIEEVAKSSLEELFPPKQKRKHEIVAGVPPQSMGKEKKGRKEEKEVEQVGTDDEVDDEMQYMLEKELFEESDDEI